MAKIAIIVIPFYGHINPTLSVGQVLLDRGHEVVWITSKDLKGLVIPNNGKLFLTNQHNIDRIDQLITIIELGKSKSAFDGYKHILEEVLIPMNIEMHREVSSIIDNYSPDLIIHDEQSYIGAICANSKEIPCVTTHAAPSGLFETSGENNVSEWYYGCLRGLQKKLNIDRKEDLYTSRSLGLTFCPKSFSDLEDMMSHQKFVGPCIDVKRYYNCNFDYSAISQNGRKNIMVSIGTLLGGEAETFFGRIVEEFAQSPYNIIVAANPAIFPEWPSNFIVQSQLPHSDLIHHLDAVITHGGANTVCDCIGMGIPLVVIPMSVDQFYVADQVAETAVGIRLKYKRLPKNEIRNSVDKLLMDNSLYKQNVVALSKKFKAAGGAHQAATFIEELLKQTVVLN